MNVNIFFLFLKYWSILKVVPPPPFDYLSIDVLFGKFLLNYWSKVVNMRWNSAEIVDCKLEVGRIYWLWNYDKLNNVMKCVRHTSNFHGIKTKWRVKVQHLKRKWSQYWVRIWNLVWTQMNGKKNSK